MSKAYYTQWEGALNVIDTIKKRMRRSIKGWWIKGSTREGVFGVEQEGRKEEGTRRGTILLSLLGIVRMASALCAIEYGA